MRRYKLLVAGLTILAGGAYLVFSNSDVLPLWFIWTVGPLLWYLGMAITLVALIAHLVTATKPVPPPTPAPVLRFNRGQQMPAGLLREIPSMGGFIL